VQLAALGAAKTEAVGLAREDVDLDRPVRGAGLTVVFGNDGRDGIACDSRQRQCCKGNEQRDNRIGFVAFHEFHGMFYSMVDSIGNALATSRGNTGSGLWCFMNFTRWAEATKRDQEERASPGEARNASIATNEKFPKKSDNAGPTSCVLHASEMRTTLGGPRPIPTP
jgi:hypothetical protein